MQSISRIGVIHLTWSRRLQKQLLPFGITIKQLHVLQALQRRRALYPSQIADMLYCDRPTATVVIRNLQKKGWITRERDAQNGRRFLILITPKGKKMAARVKESGFSGNRGFADSAILSAGETARLDKLLQKLQAGLEAQS